MSFQRGFGDVVCYICYHRFDGSAGHEAGDIMVAPEQVGHCGSKGVHPCFALPHNESTSFCIDTSRFVDFSGEAGLTHSGVGIPAATVVKLCLFICLVIHCSGSLLLVIFLLTLPFPPRLVPA